MTGTGVTFSARSWLFAPGDSERKMEKAAAGTADIALLDLEDAVTDEVKPAARAMTSAFLAARSEEDRARLWVRINPFDGPYALADLAAVIPARPGGIMLPKSVAARMWRSSTITSRRWRSPPGPSRVRPRSSFWSPRRPRPCSHRQLQGRTEAWSPDLGCGGSR